MMKYLLSIILLIGLCSSAFGTIFLDAQPGEDCAGDYNPATRSCGGGSDTSYDTLAEFNANMVAGTTNYIRAGSYGRNSGSHTEGALHIKVGTDNDNRTIVAAYPEEERQAIIFTGDDRNQYNPDPGDTTYPSCTAGQSDGGAACYYPCPAITIPGDYITISGLKTYGQVYVFGTPDYWTIQGCDLGGGGPKTNQGQVIHIAGSGPTGLITNCKIHHSAWGESDANGSALMSYDAAYTVQYCEFYDTWKYDIRVKDGGGQAGNAVTIKNSFFRPSTIFSDAGIGVAGLAQDVVLDYIYIHNNIFLDKVKGISWTLAAATETIAYNNTFIDNDVDIFCTGDQVLNFSNNLHHHSEASQRYYDIHDTGLDDLNADYNVFYSTSTTYWYNLDVNRGSTLSAWQTYSSEDDNSLSHDPDFYNASGSQPEDFKRNSYTENFTGSPYGIHAGAYETGSEQIGVDWAEDVITIQGGGSIVGDYNASGVILQ